jgi:hypothetical protein
MGDGDEQKVKQDGDQGAAGEPAPAAQERVDADGLPLDRPATLDDVRGTTGSGRAVAVSCTLVVLGLVLAFWLLRVGLLG